MKKKTIKSDLEKSLESLPDVRKNKSWTLEEDSMILRFCQTKGVRAVSETLGIPQSTVNGRYKLLLGKVGK